MNTGTVSHGTMRPEHLIPAFIAELPTLKREWYEERWSAVQAGDAETIADVLAHFDELTSQQEAIDYLLDDLHSELEDLSPDGYYFGAHPGDGSDYGWWPIEEDEPEKEGERSYE
jgi:hypothetical protein